MILKTYLSFLPMCSTLQAADCLKDCQKEFYNSFYIISDKRIFFVFFSYRDTKPYTDLHDGIQNRKQGEGERVISRILFS